MVAFQSAACLEGTLGIPLQCKGVKGLVLPSPPVSLTICLPCVEGYTSEGGLPYIVWQKQTGNICAVTYVRIVN